MKTLKNSLATLVALGAFGYANAETTETTQANAQEPQQKVDKSIPPSTKTSLMDALEGTTIGGYVYGQLTSMFGSDASGTAMRFRTAIDVNTGAYYGFSVGTRVYASIGGGAPNGKSFLENSGASPAENMQLGLQALYGRKTFESSATVITAGKMNIITPFSDSAWDFAYGAGIDNYDIAGVGFHLQAYGAWALDNSNTIGTPELVSEKPLFIFGITGDQKELAGVGFDAWVAHAVDTIDFLTFVDLNYTIAGVKLQTQIATTQVNTSSKHFDLSNTTQDLTAKLRGLYNFQLAYNSNETGIVAAAGYTGSFGDGYGALLNSTASFNMGGKIWYDTLSSGANGYGIIGTGGTKTSDGSASKVQVAYASLGYKGVKNISLSLDYAYVTSNNYMLMAKGKENHPNKTHMDVQMHEFSVSSTYAFSDKLALSVLVGSTFGDLQMGRARAKLTYKF
ncbi:hypothetical protein [Helicobacter kayseriensis]|uniref:hypothetical protein n=1 Tax=Helicobacter kayseriensis TaxID=2905877 RepID=UPI001E393BA3|nr:hypothetical protein [Helicobacter kayseriensis]MCE3047230.1 hypothetical protein [Helicobacter kayseriensis]MCE3048601.1 hypothetical protein [Helicobacter kayseriensis]